MCEGLRVASLLSVGLHRTVRATSVAGYKLPADAFVFSNLYGLNRDSRLWRSPHAFDVGHFFDEASGQLLCHNHFLPFSAGRLSSRLSSRCVY
jgi:cytochrome P450